MRKKKICRDMNFPFQIEFKVDYVVTQRKFVANFFFFYAQVNLCCDIKKILSRQGFSHSET